MEKQKTGHADCQKQDSADFSSFPSDECDRDQDKTRNEMHEKRHGPIRIGKSVQREDTHEKDENDRQNSWQIEFEFSHVHADIITRILNNGK